MRVKIFCATDEDRKLYMKYQNKNDIDLFFTDITLTDENALKETALYTAIVILTRCRIGEKTAKLLNENGVKYVLTRSAGYDHMDIAALNKYGIKAANVPLYSPNAIAEYVCMTVLMSIRNMKKQIHMIEHSDYTLNGIRGSELRNMTIGIIGTGRIGFETLKIMSSFSNNILTYDLYQKETVKEMATYVTLEELYSKSNIIIYHCPLTDATYHMLNEDIISKMKKGVVLVNPARGGLWDYDAVLKGLISGKIAGAVCDVMENEKQFLRKKAYTETKITVDETMEKLMQREDVIYTAHTAFYTDTAIENMIEATVCSLQEINKTGTCQCELNI